MSSTQGKIDTTPSTGSGNIQPIGKNSEEDSPVEQLASASVNLLADTDSESMEEEEEEAKQEMKDEAMIKLGDEICKEMVVMTNLMTTYLKAATALDKLNGTKPNLERDLQVRDIGGGLEDLRGNLKKILKRRLKAKQEMERQKKLQKKRQEEQ